VCHDKIDTREVIFCAISLNSWLGIFICDERLDTAKLNTMLTKKLLSNVPYKIFTMLKNIWQRSVDFNEIHFMSCHNDPIMREKV